MTTLHTHLRWTAAALLLMAVSALGDANLSITVTDAPDPVRVGNNLTYTISVTNSGPNTATNAIVTDVLPSSVNLVTCTPGQGTWSNDSGTVFCNLGNMANGSKVTVTIVVAPTVPDVVTNQVSVAADNSSGGRASTVTTINDANRPPQILLPDTITLPIGASTNFAVTTQDPDHDTVTLTNTVKPAGSVFSAGVFAWTATVSAVNTTNLLVFVADDQQGQTNSVVTNSMQIIVPLDADADGMPDDWEWKNFGTLTNAATGDVDNDGFSNYSEYIAGTQPTNALSKFCISNILTSATNHQVNVSTQPGRKYTICFSDQRLSNGVPWSAFATTNTGVWIETSPTSTNHVFTDDEGTNTTASTPANGMRFYKVKVSLP